MRPTVTIERRERDYLVLVTVAGRVVKQWNEVRVDLALDHFCREYRWAALKAEREAS